MAALGLAHIPGAPRSEGSKWLEAQAHLHTTLNKSRDEKLDLADACQSYDFGKRACGMVAEIPRITSEHSRQPKWRLHLGSNQGPIG